MSSLDKYCYDKDISKIEPIYSTVDNFTCEDIHTKMSLKSACNVIQRRMELAYVYVDLYDINSQHVNNIDLLTGGEIGSIIIQDHGTFEYYITTSITVGRVLKKDGGLWKDRRHKRTVHIGFSCVKLYKKRYVN